MPVHTQDQQRWEQYCNPGIYRSDELVSSLQAIRRQLQSILGMLCTAAALFLTCSVLLSWRLLLIAQHPSESEDPPVEETNYASLTPAWWPL